MCCVQYEMLCLVLLRVLFLSWWILTPLEAYCSHVKRTNTVVLLSATLPFTIYLSLRVWGGVGWGGGWKCTIYIMSGAVSDIGCIGQSPCFFPRFGAWNSCHNNTSSQCSFGTIQWAGTVTRHKIAALLKCKKWAFTCIWLPLKAKGIS